MKKILVLNSGSSTVKYQLFLADGNSFSVLAKGVAERIGLSNSLISYSYDDSVKHTKSVDLPNHEVAIKEVLQILLAHSINSLDEIAAVGHRMGHGGEYFDKSVIIDNDVMSKIYDTVDLLPLHGAAFVHGVEADDQSDGDPNEQHTCAEKHEKLLPELLSDQGKCAKGDAPKTDDHRA